MGRFVRKSNFRHVFGTAAKKEVSYIDVKPFCVGDGNCVAASTDYITYASTGGGGPVVVHPMKKTGRVGLGATVLNAHTSKVLDFAYSPFAANVLAVCSEDCYVSITALPKNPEEMKSMNGKEAGSVMLEGHQKKIDLVRWHPTALNVVASASHDCTVKLWDAEEAKEICNIDLDIEAQSIVFNTNGSLMSACGSDKKGRIFDPRQQNSVKTVKTGLKSAKIIFHDKLNTATALGSSMGARIAKVYDQRKWGEEMEEIDIDSASGIFLHNWDPDTNILYLSAKGSATVAYYEIDNKGEGKFMYSLSRYMGKTGVKGMCWLPKRTCDTKKCEIAKSLHLYQNWINPLSYVVPRKSQLFNKDIFPDTYAGKPALDAASWAAGENKDPVVKSMDPKKQGGDGGGIKIVSKAELIKENAALKKRVAELEAQLAAK